MLLQLLGSPGHAWQLVSTMNSVFFFSFVNLNDMFSTAALVLCLYLQGTFWIVYDRERERLQALAFICKGRASFQPKAYVG